VIRLLLLAALGAIPVQAGADTVVVRAGEHAGFTRLVLEFRQRPEWSLTTMEGAAVVALAEGEWRLDASRAFDRIPRSRVDSLTRTPRGVEIALACDCRVTAFEAGATAVVVDVADRSDEDALTGVQSTSSDGAPEQGPGNPEPPAVLSSSPATMTPWRTGNAPAGAPAASPDAARPVREGMVGTLTPPMPEQGPPPAGEPPHAAGELLNQLAEGIARATTQGALRLADPPGPTGTPTVPGPVAPAAANLRLRLPGEEAWLPSEPGPESPCPRNADLDVASWGPGDRTPAEAIMALRHSLAEDIDSVEEERALNLARLYVSLGFGAEARAVTEAMAQRHPQAQLLLAMALIVDGEPGPPVLPDALAECAGRARMWTALATGQATDAADVTAAVSELPLVLRRSVGPRLIEIYLAAGDEATAGAIRAAIDRAPGPHGAAFDLAAARIDVEREATSGLRTMRDLAAETSPTSDDALALLLEVAHERGEAVDAASVALAETRADDLRGTAAGARMQTGLIRALLRADDFAEAAVRLGGDGLPRDTAAVLAPEFFAALAERGQDRDVLVHAAALRAEFAGNVRDTAAGPAIATRLLDLDLPQLAGDFLPDAASDATTTALQARMRLMSGDPAGTLELLDDFDQLEPDHLALKAAALRALGRREEADAIRAEVTGAPEAGDPAAALPATPAGGSPREMVGASEEARRQIDALLAAFPSP
jgi:hypothetical protein